MNYIIAVAIHALNIFDTILSCIGKNLVRASIAYDFRCPVGIDKAGILFSDDTLRALVQTTVTDLNLTQTKSLVFKGEE